MSLPYIAVPRIIIPEREQHLPDPVLSDFPLPLRRTFYPHGFPLELATNSPDVIQAASTCWGSNSQTYAEGPMRFNLGVLPAEKTRLPARSTFRSRDHLMSLIADPDNFVICDFKQNFAFGWVTQPVAANHPVLRYRFLNSVVNMMLEQQAVAMIHGALIERNGSGVALVGESFAGKSTLAYACARAGWTYVCDDGAMLLRNHTGRCAVGDRHVIHFREDARELFPELAQRLPIARPNGKIGLEVLTRELPLKTTPGCSIEHLVFLNRNEPGAARLRPYPKDQALAWLEQVITYGAAEVRAAKRRCYQRLASAGIWELCYQSLDDAIRLLDQLVDSGD